MAVLTSDELRDWVHPRYRGLSDLEQRRKEDEDMKNLIEAYQRHREQWPEARKKIIAQIGYGDLGPQGYHGLWCGKPDLHDRGHK